jgi:hypothetical protein
MDLIFRILGKTLKLVINAIKIVVGALDKVIDFVKSIAQFFKRAGKRMSGFFDKLEEFFQKFKEYLKRKEKSPDTEDLLPDDKDKLPEKNKEKTSDVDESKESDKLDESSLDGSKTEEVVIINGRQFIKKSFGKNNTEIFIDADATDLYYYINNNFNVPYAQFNLEGRVFTPGLEVPNSLRSQGIGKSTFNDAFERLGGRDKIDRIQSDWAGSSSVSDNFDSFKKALLENKSPKEAAFETATGKWAKELGYTDVELNPSDVQSIIDGIKKYYKTNIY